MAITLSIECIGLVVALVGIGLGIAHLVRGRVRRGMAVWGLSLSLAGLLLSGWFCWQYYKIFQAYSGYSQTSFDEWIGVEAPDFAFTTLDGETVRIGELRGKRVVLDFWATWCPPCRKEIPHFIQLRNETSSDELVIVGLSSEDEETVRQFAEENGINYLLTAGSADLPEPYSQICSIPTTFFINGDGVITDIAAGYHDLESLRTKALSAIE